MVDPKRPERLSESTRPGAGGSRLKLSGTPPSYSCGETVRTAYEAFMRGDLGAAAQSFADDVEWESPDSLPNGGLVSGRDAVIQHFSEIPNYWSRFSVEPLEYIDAGEHWSSPARSARPVRVDRSSRGISICSS
jgi:hypothetical protein